jgi:ribosomal protein L11 methyltransferase
MNFKARKAGATAIARLQTCEQAARNIAALFSECYAAENAAISIVDNGCRDWTVVLYFNEPPDEHVVRATLSAAAGDAAANAVRFDRIATKDWVQESLSHLPPVRAGRFVVHGAHDRTRIMPNRIGIEIEAALAFGTGHHGTTRGCLLALDGICKARESRRKPRLLDLGTGSGVLAIAAARALRQRVLATDVDAQALRVARANARLNGVASSIEIVKAYGVGSERVYARGPFDLVFANILLGPLQRFAAALIRQVAPGGRVVLSGLLHSQASAALSAYRPLRLQRRIELDGWTTLILRRGRSKRRTARVPSPLSAGKVRRITRAPGAAGR